MQKIRNLFKHEDGFTLIELLVVIAVLGILAAIAIPRLGGVTDKARMSEASSAMGSIKTALEMDNVEDSGGLYPNDQQSFNDVVDNYLDSYTDNDTAAGTYDGNIAWSVTYTGTDPDAGDFIVTMSHDTGDEIYKVEMSHTAGGGYSDVTTGLSN